MGGGMRNCVFRQFAKMLIEEAGKKGVVIKQPNDCQVSGIRKE